MLSVSSLDTWFFGGVIIPVKDCQKDGKKGFKWGDSGKCYTYTPGNKQSKERARQKAIRQGRAIQVNKAKEKLEKLMEELENIKQCLYVKE